MQNECIIMQFSTKYNIINAYSMGSWKLNLNVDVIL